MAGIFVPIVADASKLLRSFKQSDAAAEKFGRTMNGLGVTAEKSAKAQIAATVRSQERLRSQVAVYRQVAASAEKGSREQIAAANLAAHAQTRLAKSLGVTNREAKQLQHTERSFSRTIRGGLAGSGVARGLGRSLAFASGGFLASASITAFLRSSIEQGQKAAVVQKQLAQQFRVAGMNLGAYRDQIDKTTSSISRLAGIENDEVRASFVQAFRATQNVSLGLRITAIAADVARARGITLAQATMALTRAWAGQSASLRRLGIIIPKNVSGMAALEFVSRRFAGQAAAGTTSQERFTAALKNTEETIGTALLPSFNRVLNHLTAWLSEDENQRRIQHDVNQSLKIGAALARDLGAGYRVAAAGAHAYESIASKLGKAPGPLGTLLKVLLTPGFGLQALAKLLSGGGGGGTFPPGLAGAVGTALSGAPPGVTGAIGARGGNRASLAFQLSLNDQALAKAELTAQQQDDRAVLVRREALLKQKIAKTKDLQERTALYRDLANTEGQIRQIDQDAANAAKKRHDAIVAAAKKRAALEKKHLDDLNSLAAKHNKEVDDAFNKQLAANEKQIAAEKKRAKELARQAADRLAAARDAIGSLFGGPVLNPSDAQRKTILGLPGPSAKTLTADLTAQVAQAKRLDADLARLQKQGASAQLIKELRAQGVAALPQIEALTGGSKADRQAFFKAFAQREALARKDARMTVQARSVQITAPVVRLVGGQAQGAHSGGNTNVIVKVELDGRDVAKKVTVHQQRDAKRNSGQTRGSHPGTNAGLT